MNSKLNMGITSSLLGGGTIKPFPEMDSRTQGILSILQHLQDRLRFGHAKAGDFIVSYLNDTTTLTLNMKDVDGNAKTGVTDPSSAGVDLADVRGVEDKLGSAALPCKTAPPGNGGNEHFERHSDDPLYDHRHSGGRGSR